MARSRFPASSTSDPGTARGGKRTSIVLLDPDPSAGERVGALFRARPGFHVIVASAEVDAALDTVRQARPDVVLLNLRTEGDDSLTLAWALHDAVPKSRVVITGLEPEHQDLASYVRACVFGFIMAEAPFETVLQTIRLVARGIQVLPSELTGSLFRELTGLGVRGPPERTSNMKRITRHERVVIDLMVQGLSNKRSRPGCKS